jgi:hypothetical protein
MRLSPRPVVKRFAGGVFWQLARPQKWHPQAASGLLCSHVRFKRVKEGLVPICAGNKLHGEIYNIANSILRVGRGCIFNRRGGFCHRLGLAEMISQQLPRKKLSKHLHKTKQIVSLYGNKRKARMKKFEVLFLTEARAFLLNLDQKSRDKIIFNIDKAKVKTDNELFKKLKGEIWEFRTFVSFTKRIIESLLLGTRKTNEKLWF